MSRYDRPDRRDSLSDERLRERYEDLRSLRETQPEREATAAQAALAKLTTDSEALVASLRKQIAHLKRSSPTTVVEPEGGAAELADAVSLAEKLQAENARLKSEAAKAAAAVGSSGSDASTAEAKVRVYEMMTGTKIEMDGQVARCTCAVGDKRAVFGIDMSPADGDADDVEYLPTDLTDCSEKLPEYLREPIVCERRARARLRAIPAQPPAHAPPAAAPDHPLTVCPRAPRVCPCAQSSARRLPPSCCGCSLGSSPNEWRELGQREASLDAVCGLYSSIEWRYVQGALRGWEGGSDVACSRATDAVVNGLDSCVGRRVLCL